MPRYDDVVERSSNPLTLTLCVQIPHMQMLIVLMESYDLEVVALLEKEVLRCVMNINGGQCVTPPGEKLMPK